MRRAFVTGAHGLVGRWLVGALLDRGVDVALLERVPGRPSALTLDGLRERCSLVPGDLSDADALERALAEHGTDTVFHLASQSIVGEAARAPGPTFETNVRGTWTLLEACRAHGVERVVLAASDRIYGPRGPAPVREDAALDPRAAYDVSKACADLIGRAYFHGYGVPVAVVRAANVYGPGDLERSRLVPDLVAAVVAGRPPVVRTDGSPERDFLYVADAVAAYLAVAGHLGRGAEGEAFNVGGGRPVAVREIVAALLEVAGSSLEAEYRGAPVAPEAIDRQSVDTAKLRALTGWAPRVGLHEGLARTLEWSRAHPGAAGG